MVEKKQKSEEKTQESITQSKKVTTGAWWKSTVTSSPQKKQKDTEPKKKTGRLRKSGKTNQEESGSQKEVEASQASTQAEQVEKTPADKRPPTKKTTNQETSVSLSESQTSGDTTTDEKKADVPKKPRRRGRPRKNTRPEAELKKEQKVETPASSMKDEVSVDDEKSQPVQNDQQIAEDKSKRSKKPQKRPRKPQRKKKISADITDSQVTEPKVLDTQADNQETALISDDNQSSPEAKIPLVEVDPSTAVVQKEKADIAEKLDDDVKEEPQPSGKKEQARPKPIIKLLINADEPEECRLALLENGKLESIHVATSTRTQTKNNIYKARIVAIEPNLQAAFVDYGSEKNGFLPFSEIHPEYYKENVSDKIQKIIDNQQWKKLSITDVVEKGREVLVQVVKEEVGKKGANMTTYLSLPGRCVVLMPGSDSTGISRKISGEERRSKLRSHILSMDIPEGIGWIVRTASVDITKAALGRDVNYLLRLWEDVKKKGQDLEGVGLIYQDHDHVLRFLREHFDPDIQEILVDDKDALNQVKGFVELLPAKQRNVKCKLHRGSRPIFNQYSIEDQIESIYQPKVNLPSGGSIVIDPTEALVAIDVNSGSTSRGQNFEETIFQANIEAADELARQLRLRDLGGLIVVDFIDMRSKRNIREVERQVKTAMKRDKAKVDISRISKFGLMQISRQKLGAPIEAGNYRVCSNCKGRGVVRSVETLALFYLRRIHTAASRKMVLQIECRFPLDVAQYLLNNKRNELRELEMNYNTEVVIIADPSFKPADNDIIYHKAEKDISAKKRS